MSLKLSSQHQGIGQNTESHELPSHAIRKIVVAAVAVTGMVWAASWKPAGLIDTNRYLIISSDDAGMCDAVNAGTIHALEHGSVTSAGIMVCCPAFNEFAEFAVANPDFDYGVHLTLTCDLPAQPWGPVSQREAVPSLVDADGRLHSSTYAVAQNVDIQQAEIELRAQIQKAIDARIKISHLDHHMWVLFSRPDLLQLYVKLGREFNLPIRFARSGVDSLLRGRSEETQRVYLEELEKLDDSVFPVLDYMESSNYGVAPDLKRKHHLNSLRNLPTGVTEIVLHCSDFVEAGANPPDVAQRVADTRLFSSREFADELVRSRIQLTDWCRLAARSRARIEQPLVSP